MLCSEYCYLYWKWICVLCTVRNVLEKVSHFVHAEVTWCFAGVSTGEGDRPKTLQEDVRGHHEETGSH